MGGDSAQKTGTVYIDDVVFYEDGQIEATPFHKVRHI